MRKEDLIAYKKKLSQLSEKEQSLRNSYLRDLSTGKIEGPTIGLASIDNPWLMKFTEDDVGISFPKMSMKDYLFESNMDNLDLFAINYYGNRIKYRDLFRNIENAKKAFYNMGVRNGDVVSIASPFLPEVVYAIYALNALGAVVNLVDPRVPSEKFKHYFKTSNTKYVVAYDLCAKKISEISDECHIKKTVLMSPFDSLPPFLKTAAKIKNIGKNVDEKICNGIKWNDFVVEGKDLKNVPDAEYEFNKPSVIVYTSGTSGEPKGALSSNESFNNLACTQRAYLRSSVKGDKFLLIMPPFIAYGLAIGMHGQLCRGQELLMIPKFTIDNQAKMLGDLVAKYKPQTIMGVPIFMSDLIKHPKIKKMKDCSFLKTIIVGGDSMIVSSEDEVNNYFASKNSNAKVCKGWGLTEVNSAFTYTINDEANALGSVGVPLVGNNIMVVKPVYDDNIDFDEMEEVGYDEVGEIFINSKAAIIDYLNNEEESKRVFFTSKKTGERWVRTKDLGRITPDGMLYIEGRMKRIIIRPDGHNISPFAIENVINADERVESCAVVARPNGNEHGSFAIAYIQLKNEFLAYADEIIDELKQNVSSKLPPRDVASEYKLIDEMPVTGIGKVNYKFLEEKEKELVLKRA